MRIDTERKLDFDDVLIRPKRSHLKSRADVVLERTFRLPHGKGELTGIPIVAANMDNIATVKMAKALAGFGLFTALHKYHTPDELKKSGVPGSHAFVTFGIDKPERMEEKMKAVRGGNKICLDVANGYTEAFVEFVRMVREHFPDHIIMAGNVATPDMTEALILAGADIVKVGIGPGSACLTRAMTGIGYPQLSAIIECADAAHGLSGLICADGGCRMPGDVAKAFAAGADLVMLGGMFAGHSECLSDAELNRIKKEGGVVEYYGSSSTAALTQHAGGVAQHRASEGRIVRVEYRGDVKNTVHDILGGLRSACTYVGAGKLKELSKRATFVVKN